MNQNVIVCDDEHGNVVVLTQNPAYAYVRVEQIVEELNENGWLNDSVRSALIKGPTQKLVIRGFKKGMELSGRIAVKESLTPFDHLNPDKDIKIAGETGVECKIGNQPIYRRQYYDPSGTREDVLLKHDNTVEIQAANAISRSRVANLQV
jgi:hypothetical protein